MVLVLVILLLYRYYGHCYYIHMILGSIHAHPRPCLLLRQYLPQFLLQYRLQVFLCQILLIHSLSCHPKWVFLLPTQKLDIGKMWIFLIFAGSSTLLTTSSHMGNFTQSLLWIYFPVYSDMEKCPPSLVDSLKALTGVILLFNVFVFPVYTMA